MESLRGFPALFHHHDGPLRSRQFIQGNTEDFVISFGIGLTAKFQTAALVNPQGSYRHAWDAKVIGIADAAVNGCRITIKFPGGAG